MFINNYVSKMISFSECLTWFILHDKIINKLVDKYFNEQDINENESKLLFDRYNMCNRILLNQELIFDEETVNQMLDLCPDETWRTSIQIDFDQYNPMDATRCRLDMLDQLRLFTFHNFRQSTGLERFRGDIHSQKIQILLGEIYDDINGIDI